MSRLPVSVILPTLNCREKLIRHLDQSAEWLERVEEIIAIDSYSDDGTWEVLKERVTGNRSKLIQAERGLYRSWNLAIAMSSQPSVYLSTIGDIIDIEGLTKLHSWLKRGNLDVVISSPRIMNEDETPSERRWPIHKIDIPLQADGGPWQPNSSELLVMSCIFVPETIIGSSASNLYKTEVLKKYPFPEDCGTIGDVLWGMRHLSMLRTGITNTQCASFLWDGDRSGTWERSLRFQESAKAFFADAQKTFPQELRPLAQALLINIQLHADRIENIKLYDEWTRWLLKKKSLGIFALNLTGGRFTRCVQAAKKLWR